MAAIRLRRLPNRTPVKVTIMIAPELQRALAEYADAYRSAYGEGEPVTELIPAILTSFLDADRGFARARRSKKAQS